MSWLVSYGVSARRVMDANPDHAGLKAACAELQRLLDQSRQAVAVGSDDPLSVHFARLASHGATPPDVIAMYAAVALHEREYPRALRDADEFRFAVARAVCGVVPRQGIVLRSQALDRIGRYMVERYAGLAGGILAAVDKAEVGKRQRSAAMLVPFTTP